MTTITQSIAAYIAAETAEAQANGSAYDVAIAELAALDALAKKIESQIKACRELAVEDGFAMWAESTRENAPSKARYIELHGQDAFDAHKLVTPVKRFTWL